MTPHGHADSSSSADLTCNASFATPAVFSADTTSDTVAMRRAGCRTATSPAAPISRVQLHKPPLQRHTLSFTCTIKHTDTYLGRTSR